MKINNWIFERLTGDVIDRNFVLSDLKNIPISDQERFRIAQYDALSAADRGQGDDENRVPIGKTVL